MNSMVHQKDFKCLNKTGSPKAKFFTLAVIDSRELIFLKFPILITPGEKATCRLHSLARCKSVPGRVRLVGPWCPLWGFLCIHLLSMETTRCLSFEDLFWLFVFLFTYKCTYVSTNVQSLLWLFHAKAQKMSCNSKKHGNSQFDGTLNFVKFLFGMVFNSTDLVLKIFILILK
jgi:hypothetical protein